jgi:hypothetical protein
MIPQMTRAPEDFFCFRHEVLAIGDARFVFIFLRGLAGLP